MADLEPLIAAMWVKAAPMLSEALDHSAATHNIEDVMLGIAEGRLQLWLGERCAAVSHIMEFPRRRVLNMFLAGGDLTELKTIQAGAEAFARGHACQAVQAGARLTGRTRKDGWTGSFDGYEPQWIQYMKELT